MRLEFRNVARLLSTAVLVVAFAGCGSFSPAARMPGQAVAPQTSKFVAKPWIYVANSNYDDPTVTVYGRRADGDAAPLQTIAGSNTELRQPIGIAVDRRGKIYVANVFGGGSNGYGSVLIFAPGANGNAAPVGTITTGLNYPFGVSLDSSDNVYVANNQGQSVTVYAAKTYTPIRAIFGRNTQLYPVGLTLDASGKLYVANFNDEASGSGWITVYNAGADGDVQPIEQIHGYKTGLTDPAGGIAVDANGNIYVANGGYPKPQSLLVFAAGAHGDAKPIRKISGSKTQLTWASGLALDARGRIFATTTSPLSGPTSVLVFAPDARGNVPPVREITGDQTGLFASAGIFVR